MKSDFRLTLIHPCVGRKPGKRYLRTWEMEPLPMATLAGLTPDDVDVRFYDDRIEDIPFDEPTDAVALSVETYTAKRCYQIASEYRKRGVPVVMGGFHASLLPEEVAEYAEVTVEGEAEAVWDAVIDDLRHGRAERRYRSKARPSLRSPLPDRSIFEGKRYVPVRLIEFGRGCRFNCNFCAIQSVFENTQNLRPTDRVIEELRATTRPGDLVFFVDDNFTVQPERTKEFLRELEPLGIRWVGQASIQASYDDELLALMARSGCHCVLVGIESLDPRTLRAMHKSFNHQRGGPEVAIKNFRRHGIRIYGTFMFGYDEESSDSFERSQSFAEEHALYIAAFNHVTPFPGTPLYAELAEQSRLRFDPWWLSDEYLYGMIPFEPQSMSPDELETRCFDARRRFYSWRSIARRGLRAINRDSLYTLKNFWLINSMLRFDVGHRQHFPLGDPRWSGPLLTA